MKKTRVFYKFLDYVEFNFKKLDYLVYCCLDSQELNEN